MHFPQDPRFRPTSMEFAENAVKKTDLQVCFWFLQFRILQILVEKNFRLEKHMLLAFCDRFKRVVIKKLIKHTPRLLKELS